MKMQRWRRSARQIDENNQNMIEIEESGMKFGLFEFSHVFQIEKSKLYKNLHNIKTVEFILENNNTDSKNGNQL